MTSNLRLLKPRFRATDLNRWYVFVLFFCLLILSGCNRNEESPTATPTAAPVGIATLTTQSTNKTNASVAAAAPAPTAAPTPVTGHITLWHSWSQAEGDALAALLSQFQEAYPGVQLETLFVAPDALVSSYSEAVAAGSGPDLLLAPNWWLGELVEANAIVNLDTVANGGLAENFESVYWPATLDAMRSNDSLYGLPVTYNLVSLFVNKDLVPQEGLPSDTNTLLTSAGITMTSGIGLYATLLHTYWGFPAFGSQFLDTQGNAILDQSEGSAAYLAWLKQLNDTPGSYVSSDYGMLLDRFKKGEFAYLVDGPWAIAELHQALGDALSVAPLPSGPSGPAQPWLYSDGLFINPTTSPDQQKLALQVAQFLSGEQAGNTLATIGPMLPAARNTDLSSQPLLQGFATQAASATAMPTTSTMNEVWTYGSDMITKAMTEAAPLRQIVKETATLINEANAN